MTVGEIVLYAFLQVLFDRLVPRDLYSFFPHVLPELQKWKKKLLKMEAVLADAEEKKLTDKPVKMWLDDLRDLAYDLEDLLDELATEELERKLMTVQNNNINSRSTSLLENIHVHNCPALACLSSSGQLPTTLKNLFMVYCSQLTMLSSGLLPKTLCSLFITDVPKLESIAKRFHNDMSLEYIWITDCDNLKSLPEGCPNLTFFPEYGLPSSLLRLQIRDCPLLEKQCRRDDGKVRSLISHIPCVEIDFKFIGDDTEEEK
ncbi:hypothetical protein Q3G72_024014 [Acer saccharum]|nr:hypothetical protein Q3G72_024014 [Acer saccharum]